MLANKFTLHKKVKILFIAGLIMAAPALSAYMGTQRASALPSPSEPTFVGGADASGGTNTGSIVSSLGNTNANKNIVLQDDYAYVAKAADPTDCGNVSNRSGCELHIYNISNPTAPSFVAGIDSTSGINSGTGDGAAFNSVVVSGDYLYLAKAGLSGDTDCANVSNKIGCELQIYNISNPASPTWVGGADASGTTNGGVTSANMFGMQKSGNYVYTAGASNTTNCNSGVTKVGCEIKIFDVSNPAAPTFAAGIDSTGAANAGTGTGHTFSNLKVSGSTLFAVKNGDATDCSSGVTKVGCELHAYDISNPLAPTWLGGADVSGTTNGGTQSNAVYAVEAAGDTLYLGKIGNTADCASGEDKVGCEIQVYDVSNPAAPTFVNGIDSSSSLNSGTANANVHDFSVHGDNLYVAFIGNATDCNTAGNKTGCELQAYDISDPDQPTYEGGADSSGTANVGTSSGSLHAVVAAEGYVYTLKAATGGNCSARLGCELQVYDVDSSAPDVIVTAPGSSSQINTWSPAVDWGGAETCEYSWDASTWQEVSCAANGANIPAPAEGDRTLHVRGTSTGLEGTDSVSFSYDATAPTVDAGANRSASGQFTQSSASASDNGSGIASYAWTKQSGPGTITFNASYELDPVISADQDGTYVARLTVTDNVGNTNYDDFTFIWDTTPADVSLNAFPGHYTNQSTVIFAYTADEDLSEPVTFECSLNNASFTSCADSITYNSLVDGDHDFTVRSTDSVGNQTTASYSWTIDTIKPVITRSGPAQVIIELGDTYSDQGATASDNMDGNITDNIFTSGSVNTNAPGKYVITYNVNDAAGNSADEVTRTVLVFDDDDADKDMEDNAPNDGDANNDGTADSLQANVTSLKSTVTGNYVTLANSEGCANRNVSMTTGSSLSSKDAGYEYPAGLMNFTLDCTDGTPGLTVHVTQYYFGESMTDLVARKFNATTGTYMTIPDATTEQVTIGGKTATKVSYQITDGGILDEDSTANGVIVDPSGLGKSIVSAPNTGTGSISGHDKTIEQLRGYTLLNSFKPAFNRP